jgi:hypothetical protein
MMLESLHRLVGNRVEGFRSEQRDQVNVENRLLRRNPARLLTIRPCSWLVFAPQRKDSFGDPLKLGGLGEFAVKERQRIEGRGFQVFGEPAHRMTAAFLAAVSSNDSKKEQLTNANAATSALRDEHRGVMLLYAIRQHRADPASIGFELLFPQNNLPFDIDFTVRRKGESATLVMDDADGDN